MAKMTKATQTREAGGLVRLAATGVTPAIGSSEADRTIEVIACTSAPNNHDARVLNDSWDLSRYEKNPIVLYSHAWEPNLLENLRPEDTLPIGKASNIRVEGDSLLASITFATADINPFAEQVFRAFQGGYLNAVSVGFHPHSVAFEIVDDREIAVLSDCELYEISVVPVPADAGAVAVRNASSLHAFASSARARSPMTITQQAAETATEEKPVEGQSAPEAEKPVEQAAERTCPECGAVNPEGSKFCNQCGESLTESAAEGEPAPAEQADGEAKDKIQSLRALTGTRTRVQALGVVEGWRLAAQSLPGLQARIAELETAVKGDERKGLIEKLSADRKLTPAMRGWAQTVDLAALRAFAAVAAPIAALASKGVEAPPSNAKTWESMGNMERHALAVSDRTAFEALRADYLRRTSAR